MLLKRLYITPTNTKAKSVYDATMVEVRDCSPGSSHTKPTRYCEAFGYLYQLGVTEELNVLHKFCIYCDLKSQSS